MLAILRHETFAHAIPNREVRDLGDALLLTDPRDADPFWNRLVGIRWPADAAAFDRRLAEALALFGVLDRRPHVWPAPVHDTPADLVSRLTAHGFRDVGGGHVMVLVDDARCPPVPIDELSGGVTLERIAAGDDGDARVGVAPREVAVDFARVLIDAFSGSPERVRELAADLETSFADARVTGVLARVDGEPAAVAKATTFDGIAYLSSIGTRPAFRARSLGALVSRVAVAIGREGGARLTYLGVFSGNGRALRLYDRLGFASIGESPDLLLR